METHSMPTDLRDAIRALRGAPTYTAVALIVLALGIGASTAIFSVVDAVVIRALPFDEHDRLMAVGERTADAPSRRPSSVAPQNYLDWRARQAVFDGLGAWAWGSLTLREADAEPEELRTARVTHDLLPVLRVSPARGRQFEAGEEVDGRHRVLLITDGLWRRRFGADPAIVGRTIGLDGGTFEIVGVLPPGFSFPVGVPRPAEALQPLVIPANEQVRDPTRRSIYLQVVGRLRPGVDRRQAEAQMEQIALALEQEHPKWNENSRVAMLPLQEQLVGENTRKWMWLMLGAVALVLLIACANVANLMVARATAREREIGIRAALGAGRLRLARQVLVESLVLAAAGTVLGVLLAWWGVHVLRASLPDGVPRVASIALDLRVLGVAGLMALATGAAFGLLPAWQASRPDLTHALKDGARGATAGRGRQRLRSTLVVVEVALALVLLVGAGLFISSFMTLLRNEPGFDMRNLLTSTVRLRVEPGATERGGPMLQAVVERLQQTPGIQSAAAISGGMPLSGSMTSTTFRLPGQDIAEAENISIRSVTPGYHETMRIPLGSGRLLTVDDRREGLPVVLVNEAAVQKFFAGRDPIGQTVAVEGDREIVGVVGNVRQFGPESEQAAEAYIPLSQVRRTTGGEIVVRTAADPLAALPAVKAAVFAAAPDVPLRNIATMEELHARRVAQRRFNMLLLGLFGALALVICAVGIYGVLAYIVAQRTHEIGVRMALGASRGSVVSMVLRKATVLVAIGLIAGGTAAWFLSATAEAFLFNVEPTDPRVFAAAGLVMALAGLLASTIPAVRASKVDPMVALRQE
jgi:putative ABC transport system permease protein